MRVDVMDNLFNLRGFDIPPQFVIDVLDRGIGAYLSNQRVALWRTVNPVWWIGQLLSWVAEIPFYLMAGAGFDAENAKKSTWGRIMRLAIQLMSVVGTGLAGINALQ